MTLGENIFNLRKKRQLSQEQLATHISVTRQTISNWESNITSPNVDQLKQLSQLFDVSIDNLLDNDKNPVFIEKMSSSDKFFSLLIKVIKFFGIILLLCILLNILAFVLFSNYKTEIKTDYSTQQILK